MAEITFVKGESSALDRTWMSMPDGSTRQLAVHVVHDLPHLVVESLFGIDDGLWGVLAQGGFSGASTTAPSPWLLPVPGSSARPGPVGQRAGCYGLSGHCPARPSASWVNPGVEISVNPDSHPWADAAHGGPEAR